MKRIAVFGLILVVAGLPVVMALSMPDVQASLNWVIETVDTEGHTGDWTSLALDSSDRPHISYHRRHDALKYARWTGSAWSIEIVDLGADVGEHSSLALDSDDRPHISYQDGTNGDLKYATAAIRPISIYTDKYYYSWLDTMHLGLGVNNRLDHAVTVCVAIWLEMPNALIYLLLHAHAITLPAVFTYSNPDFRTFVLPQNIPSGIYTWHAAFLRPSNHQILLEDTAKWEFS